MLSLYRRSAPNPVTAAPFLQGSGPPCAALPLNSRTGEQHPFACPAINRNGKASALPDGGTVVLASNPIRLYLAGKAGAAAAAGAAMFARNARLQH